MYFKQNVYKKPAYINILYYEFINTFRFSFLLHDTTYSAVKKKKKMYTGKYYRLRYTLYNLCLNQIL